MGCVDKAVYAMLRCATLRELSNNAQGLVKEIYVCCDSFLRCGARISVRCQEGGEEGAKGEGETRFQLARITRYGDDDDERGKPFGNVVIVDTVGLCHVHHRRTSPQ